MRVSHMLGFRPAEELLDEALCFGEIYGITTFKLKVGRRPLSLDIEACRVLREGLGEDVELYLDANRGWPDSAGGLGGARLRHPHQPQGHCGEGAVTSGAALPHNISP